MNHLVRTARVRRLSRGDAKRNGGRRWTKRMQRPCNHAAEREPRVKAGTHSERRGRGGRREQAGLLVLRNGGSRAARDGRLLHLDLDRAQRQARACVARTRDSEAWVRIRLEDSHAWSIEKCEAAGTALKERMTERGYTAGRDRRNAAAGRSGAAKHNTGGEGVGGLSLEHAQDLLGDALLQQRRHRLGWAIANTDREIRPRVTCRFVQSHTQMDADACAERSSAGTDKAGKRSETALAKRPGRRCRATAEQERWKDRTKSETYARGGRRSAPAGTRCWATRRTRCVHRGARRER